MSEIINIGPSTTNERLAELVEKLREAVIYRNDEHPGSSPMSREDRAMLEHKDDILLEVAERLREWGDDEE